MKKRKILLRTVSCSSGNSLNGFYSAFSWNVLFDFQKEFKRSPLVHETLTMLLCLNGTFCAFILIPINSIRVGDFPADSLICRVIIDVR